MEHGNEFGRLKNTIYIYVFPYEQKLVILMAEPASWPSERRSMELEPIHAMIRDDSGFCTVKHVNFVHSAIWMLHMVLYHRRTSQQTQKF